MQLVAAAEIVQVALGLQFFLAQGHQVRAAFGEDVADAAVNLGAGVLRRQLARHAPAGLGGGLAQGRGQEGVHVAQALGDAADDLQLRARRR